MTNSGHLDFGGAIGQEDADGMVLSSVDVNTGEVQPIELVAPYVDAFARQPVTADTPKFRLP